jgi:hypothetical protein
LVLGTGPLVELWAEGAGRIPELDGLLPSSSLTGLLASLDVVASGGASSALAEALSISSGVRADLKNDRKLVDYAAYSEGMGAPWPTHSRIQPSRPRRLVNLVRRAPRAPVVSPVVVHDEEGVLLPPGEVMEEIRQCDLLGIGAIDLVAGPQSLPPDGDWYRSFLPSLRVAGGARRSSRRIRLAAGAASIDQLPLAELDSMGVVAIDLGEVPAGDEPSVADARGAARRCRRHGLQPTGSLVLGRPGFSMDLERLGVEEALADGFPTEAAIEVRLGAVDPAAWTDWLDAPSGEFSPPGMSEERVALVHRAREALQPTGPERRGLRVLARRVLDGI